MALPCSGTRLSSNNCGDITIGTYVLKLNACPESLDNAVLARQRYSLESIHSFFCNAVLARQRYSLRWIGDVARFARATMIAYNAKIVRKGCVEC
jgi:hypothetical protein